MNLGETEPSDSHGGEAATASPSAATQPRVTFDRRELNRILGLYGRKSLRGNGVITLSIFCAIERFSPSSAALRKCRSTV